MDQHYRQWSGTDRNVAIKVYQHTCRPVPNESRFFAKAETDYCLSKTDVPETFLPLASVPFVTSVRVLPSSERVMVPVVVAFPSFLFVSS